MKTKSLFRLVFSKKPDRRNVLLFWGHGQKRSGDLIKRLTPSHFSWVLGLFLFTAALPGFALPQIEVAKLLASDGAEADNFGYSVSIDGDRTVVGARFDGDSGLNPGSAYVFERDGAGNWNEVAKLTASDGAEGDQFGVSVSVNGDRAMVGAVFDDDSGIDSGSAYVFERDSFGNWNEVAKLIASDGATLEEFGDSVSIDGDRAVVGAALGIDGNGINSGSAYVFERDGLGNWNETAKLTAPNAAAYDFFGTSVSIDGNRAVVGASSDDDSGFSSGSAYVFERDGLGNWNEAAKLTASDGAEFDRFGSSVSIAGDRVVVGAHFDDDNGFESGSAYVFERDGLGIWNEATKLIASDGSEDDRFGRSVSIDGDRALVGAWFDDNSGSQSGSPYVFEKSGSAYVFERDGLGNWNEAAKLTASDGAEDDVFGFSVSIDGDRAVVGAWLDDDSGRNSGSAYVFDLENNTAPTLTSSNSASVPENQISVIDVQAIDDSDSEGSGLSYSKTGGADQALFSLDTNTGVVTFNNTPDFEAPADAGANNNYEIQVTVTDAGGLTDVQDIVITVTDVNENVVIHPLWIPVDRSSDDAEEQVSNGNMDLTSSDLELTRESFNQLIGIRFNGLTIPPGATIDNAYIQFTVDEMGSEETVLTLQAEATANAATFSNNEFDISNRMRTTELIQWTVQPWNTKGIAGSDQATPDLSAILQELIDGGGWASGNSIAFIITGSGRRVAESFTGTAPSILHVEFSTMLPVSQAPDAVDDGTDVNPAYTTGFGQQLTVSNGVEDIVERNDDVGYPAAVVIGFGPGGSFPAGQQGYSREEGELVVYADGSFSYTPLIGFSGVDYFDYVLENGGGQDIARVYIEVLNETPLWIPVDRSSDDAEEASNGNMDLTSSDLELTRESSNQQIGIRFNGLSIPQGATIREAYIQFQADETDTEETILMLKAEDTGNAATFKNSVIDFDISKRILTTAQVQWTVPAWNSVGDAGSEQATPDLSIIIQELVNRDDWAQGNSIAFIITGSGRRVAESYNGTAPPMLHLIYSIQPPVNQMPDAVDDGTFDEPAYSTNSLGLTVPNGAEDIVERNDDIDFLAAEVFSFGATGGESLAGEQGESTDGGDLKVNADGSFSYTPRIGFSGVDSFDYVLKNSEGQDTATVFIAVLNETSLWISVDRNSDDAEEQLSNGIMDLTSSDLELIRELDNQQVGIRFNGLAIPQGATIVEAYIQFQVDEIGSKLTVLTLQAEDTANAMTFSNTGFDISSRTPTLAQMQWTVPAWNTIGAAGFDQATPNLAAIVQEVVDRGDWVLGNSMAFISTGSGRRVAESFSGTASPILHVTYSNVPLP